jgi:hypothetical protein
MRVFPVNSVRLRVGARNDVKKHVILKKHVIPDLIRDLLESPMAV